MSATQPTLTDVIRSAIESVIVAVAHVVRGVGDALANYASIVGTVVVMVGLGYLAWRGIERIMPFIRGILGRLF
jgi:hypothetical protein